MPAGGSFEQSYNAQAAVDIESRLIDSPRPGSPFGLPSGQSVSLRSAVGQHVTQAPNDKQQLSPTLAALSPVIQSVEHIPSWTTATTAKPLCRASRAR